ncbi:unnamed protein product [Nezara viridula]|uniref:Uncharacterized protein n=1 Tax=Nezara viridula TaxID=85310 RepID=A0A9P0HD61_NEZVI|nr:unnamed protein product [Nezara viridula]
MLGVSISTRNTNVERNLNSSVPFAHIEPSKKQI